MLNEMVVDWMQMGKRFHSGTAVRLLCVDAKGDVPRELLDAAARSGIEVMSIAGDLDDALRQALMGLPDIIVLPYLGDQVLDFLRALEHMRSASFSPYVVLVAGEDHGNVLEKCDSFYGVSVMPRSRVTRHLLPHLLHIAGELRADT